MDAKRRLLNLLGNYNYSGDNCAVGIVELTISETSVIANFIEQQAKLIENMKICENCHYENDSCYCQPCNSCIRDSSDNKKDYWKLSSELLAEEGNGDAR